MDIVKTANHELKKYDDDALHPSKLRKQSEPIENSSCVLVHDVADEKVGSQQNLSLFFFEVSLSMVETDERSRQLFLRSPGWVVLDCRKSELLNLVEVAVVLGNHFVDLEIAVLITVLINIQSKLAVKLPFGNQGIFEKILAVEEQLHLEIVQRKVVGR